MTIEAKLDRIIQLLEGHATPTQTKSPAPKFERAQAEAKKPEEPKQLTYDDVKAPFLALVKNKGREAGVALLKKFGAEKLPDVKPEQFQAVLDAIKEAEKVEGALA